MVMAPLSLSNVLTMLVALACLGSLAQQSRGDIVRLWKLAVPPSLAVAEALMLLAGMFEATLYHDAQWLIAALIGTIVGRMRGWSVPLLVDQTWRLVRLPPTFDAIVAAVCLIGVATVDFVSAALEEPIVAPDQVAAAAALFAGYIGGRAVALFLRAQRQPHVVLSDPPGTSVHGI